MLTNTTTASDCQTPCGQVSGDQREQRIEDMDMEGKTLRNGGFLERDWKMP